MRIEVAGAQATVLLGPGEAVRVAPPALRVLKGAEFCARPEGALRAVWERLIGTRQALTATVEARLGPGVVMLAPELPGEATVLQASPHAWFAAERAILAAEPNTELAYVAQSRGLFEARRDRAVRFAGEGRAVVATHGPGLRIDLLPGEEAQVSDAAVVAVTEGIVSQIARFALGRKRREWNPARFVGPGTLLVDSWSLPPAPPAGTGAPSAS